MSFATFLEEGLRPSKRCPEGAVWNPARQRCQDRFTGEPVMPDPTYPEESEGSSNTLLQLLLEITRLGSAMLSKPESDKE